MKDMVKTPFKTRTFDDGKPDYLGKDKTRKHCPECDSADIKIESFNDGEGGFEMGECKNCGYYAPTGLI